MKAVGFSVFTQTDLDWAAVDGFVVQLSKDLAVVYLLDDSNFSTYAPGQKTVSFSLNDKSSKPHLSSLKVCSCDELAK